MEYVYYNTTTIEGTKFHHSPHILKPYVDTTYFKLKLFTDIAAVENFCFWILNTYKNAPTQVEFIGDQSYQSDPIETDVSSLLAVTLNKMCIFYETGITVKIVNSDLIPSGILAIKTVTEYNSTVNHNQQILIENTEAIRPSKHSGLFAFENIVKIIMKDTSEKVKYFEVIDPPILTLAMIVKNAGGIGTEEDIFEGVLRDNLPHIDTWCFLDTGSTDQTIPTINTVMAGKPGKLYCEDFIGFPGSRNRNLDLCKKCEIKTKYILMIDDTYVIKGDIRKFLQSIQSDQLGTTMSPFIHSWDVHYTSNRIIKYNSDIRYIREIHEILDTKDNVNIVIPYDKLYLQDRENNYMKKRTIERQESDLKILYKMLEENPSDHRQYYYLGNVYRMMGEYQKSVDSYIKYVNFPTDAPFRMAVFDATYEIARTTDMHLNKPWAEIEPWYLKAAAMEPMRFDPWYSIGHHYNSDKPDQDKGKAYEYFKRCYEIGYNPEITQYNCKPTMYYKFLPWYLARLAYEFKDWNWGIKAVNLFFSQNPYYINTLRETSFYPEMVSWKEIYTEVYNAMSYDLTIRPKKTIVMIVDGNWNPWTGSDILKKGLGGSETCMVQVASWIPKDRYNVVFFCNTPTTEVFRDVSYRPIKDYYAFCSTNIVHICIVSRFTKYVALLVNLPSVYQIRLVFHDLTIPSNVIPCNPKTDKIICLSDFHCSEFTGYYPGFKNITYKNGYGIDWEQPVGIEKIKNNFIYSSFANRGLIILLTIWPDIKQALPDASLDIYCDIYHPWILSNYPGLTEQLAKLIDVRLDIRYHSWVSKSVLKEAWYKADYWLYPCIFTETFCLTALEAARSKTLAISVKLGSLTETIGDRGLMYQDINDLLSNVVSDLKTLDSDKKQELIDSNYDWSLEQTWESKSKIYYE
jgi:glycosyltransferase involved in cell wall biosynthesis